ncbi:Ribonuclease J [Candidatus Bilamarchaeum dharawalense]|uniref:Ribonuclease J n=1 Tax=Candidatus Bilamarchaeum dharawalense TaxID=2885759 RepID=A0A5E4LSC9_9ARCH|nr:Ribonuclease J [Candidatus Bilamarchaeum dharawalense]
MRLTFYGGAQEVGRVCMLLEEGPKNLMLDCGIKLGETTEYPLIHEDELLRIRNISVSHAHLDHSGYLPHVYSKKARPKIFMTKPTRDLIGVLLSDYQRIQAAKHEGKKLFGSKDVDDVMRDARIIEYLEPFQADFKVQFHSAGHIMGSAMTMIENGPKKILFSGDICMRKTRVLDPCERGLSAETLIVENTYGTKEDILPSYRESYQKMISIIKETVDKGGHIIIPSFAVGRAQEVLLALDDYMRSGAIPPMKIFMDGMIGKAMKIYRHNAIYANDDIKKRILMSEDDPFKSPNFHHPRSKTREDVLKEPCIIVTTSGMLSGGPVLFYLEKLAHDPRNAIIFVGYQAEGTTGNKVLQNEKKIQIYGKEVELKLRIESIRLSGHADFNELIQYIRSVKGLKRVFLMHGEKSELKDSIDKDYDVIVPRQLETYAI